MDPNPAIISNRCTTWVAEGLERVESTPRGDGEEEIEVVHIPAAEVMERVVTGEIRHALVVAALALWSHRR